MLLIENIVKMVSSLNNMLAKKFEMKDLHPTKSILRMHIIIRDCEKHKLWIGQEKCIKEMLKKINMIDCEPIGTLIPLLTKLFVEKCQKPDEEAK